MYEKACMVSKVAWPAVENIKIFEGDATDVGRGHSSGCENIEIGSLYLLVFILLTLGSSDQLNLIQPSRTLHPGTVS